MLPTTYLLMEPETTIDIYDPDSCCWKKNRQDHY